MIYLGNKVRDAISRIGGVTKAANKLGCSGTTVHNYIRNRRVTDLERAMKLAELAHMDVQELRPCR